MNVSFYFDPSCPFCWITSRWLLMVRSKRDLTISWEPFSLALKNDELDGGDGAHRDSHIAAHRLLRVMTAVQEIDQNVSLLDLYTATGIQHHIGDEPYDDKLIAAMLAEHNLPADLLAAADDKKYDSVLQQSIDSATETVGYDIGVPTIIFDGDNGLRQGYFGPVLQQLPDMDEALKLWDGLSSLATCGSFYELKRSRPDGDPDVFSTAKC